MGERLHRGPALAGIARLGLDEVHRIDRETRRLNTSLCDKTRHNPSADVSAEIKALLRIWKTKHRQQTATNVAFVLTFDRMQRRRAAQAVAA